MTGSGAQTAPGLVLTALSLGLMLLAPGVVRAAGPTSYAYQLLAQIGGMAGDVPIPKGLYWSLGPLNDNGQFLVNAGTVFTKPSSILLQYGDGKFTPLVAAGMDGPLGPWPKDVVLFFPFSSNGRGDGVLQVGRLSGAPVGTFYRDAQSDKMTAVVLPGMPATGNLTFGGFAGGVAINDRDEIALADTVKGTGTPTGIGLFFRTPDGALQPIFVPGQTLPDGKKGALTLWVLPSITDAGVVAFLAQRSGNSLSSAYQWEKGTLTPLVLGGMDAPGGGKVAAVSTVLLNNQNASALISARVTGTPGHGLYRLAGGTLIPVAVPGQAMPGGGKFKSIPYFLSEDTYSVGAATESGQHAFVATLDDNSTAVYRLEADGTLALVVKSGMTTPLGKITRFGQYCAPAMNSKGQVVASISFDSGPDTLVLLTPAGQ